MFSIIDGSMGPYPSECIKKFMGLALRCSLDETKYRPSMLEVVRELENISSMVTEFDSSNSNMSTSAETSSSLYAGNNYVTMELPRSELVSGVIPTIKPR